MTKNNDPYFNHFVLLGRNINYHLLEDTLFLKKSLSSALKSANLPVIKSTSHKFTPHGYSLVFILSASHLAVHTWPEHGFIHLDLVTCTKTTDIKLFSKLLKSSLKTTNIKTTRIKQ